MHYQTPAQIRAAEPDLADVGKFTDRTLEEYVAAFEGIASDYRGVSYEARTSTWSRVLGESTCALWLTPKIRSITSVTVTSPAVGGTPTAVSDTAYSYDAHDGILLYPRGFWAGARVAVVYAHGFGYRTLTDGVTTSGDATVTSATGGFVDGDIGLPISGAGIPAGSRIASINSTTSIEISANATASGTGVALSIIDPILRSACCQYVRACALAGRSGVPRDVIAQSIEGLTTRFSTPDKAAGRPTGYLDVDRLLNSLQDFRTLVG